MGMNVLLTSNILKELDNKKYFVRVPEEALYTEEELKMFGIRVDVERKGKVKMPSRTNVVYLSAKQILDIYKDGFPIYLVDRDKIYEFASMLDDMYVKLKNSVDGVNSPYTEIIDEFLTEVLHYNKHRINTVVNDDIKKAEEELGFDLFEDVRPTGPEIVFDKNKFIVD